ncbi:HB2L protein, partial [Oxyruncus cristatus]|nr:HB2L protein [Oxyruncus cristatus]
IYNRQQYVHFDSDVGVFVGDTPRGEIQAREWNSNQEWLDKEEILEYNRAAVDTFCRHNYEGITPFSVNRRVPPIPSQCLPVH